MIGTYLTRIPVRIDGVWPVFHRQSFAPLVDLLSQDSALMVKACLIVGATSGVFFVCAPRSLVLCVVSTVLLMNALVLVGRT